MPAELSTPASRQETKLLRALVKLSASVPAFSIECRLGLFPLRYFIWSGLFEIEICKTDLKVRVQLRKGSFDEKDAVTQCHCFQVVVWNMCAIM